MEVRLPDGTVIKGVPDNATKADIIGKLQLKGYDVSSLVQQEAGKMALEGMSGTDKFFAGAGKFVSDVGQGVRQMVGLEEQGDVDATRARDQPLLGTGAGMAGNLAGGLASTVPATFIPGANALVGSTAIGAGLGLTQPTATGESRALNFGVGVAGGSLGYGAGRLLGKAVTPAQRQVTPQQTRSIAGGQRLGMQVTPGVRSGSPGFRGLEASMESYPFTSGPIKGIKAMNQSVLNRAAAKSIGENTDEMTGEVLSAARTRIGSVFDSVEQIKAIPVDQSVATKLAAIETKYRGLLDRPLTEYDVVKDIYANLGRQITGKQYNDWQSQLGKIARSKFTGGRSEPNVGFALMEAKNALDDAASLVMSGPQKQAFNTARQQWRNLVMLETGNVVNEQTGDVSGRLLANVLSRKDKSGFRLGGNASDLYDATRFYKATPGIVGDSGTATRSSIPWMIGQSALGGLAGGQVSDDPRIQAAGFAAPLALGLLSRGGQAAYLSRPLQGYLANQVLSPMAQRGLGTAGGLLGAQTPLLGGQ